MSPEPEEDLNLALHDLAALAMTHRVKETNDLKARIVRRWPDSAAAKRLAAEIAAAKDRGRSRLKAAQYEKAVSRAQRETAENLRRFKEHHRSDASSVAEAEKEAAQLTTAAAARRRAAEENKRDEPFAAVVFARRAVALTPDAPSLEKLAACLRRVGDYPEALDRYRDAWSLRVRDEGDEGDTKYLLTGAAAILADLAHLSQAKDLLAPVLVDHPDDLFAQHAMGRIQRLLGELDAAATSLKRAAANPGTGAQSELRKLLTQARDAGRMDLVAAIERSLN